jgi:putative addiction module component (TIGR02574 family)
MSSLAEPLKTLLASLSREERADLAYYLIHSLDDDGSEASSEEIDAAWLQELQRRATAIEQGTDRGEAAEKVFAELRKKYAP